VLICKANTARYTYHAFLNSHPKELLSLQTSYDLKDVHPVVQGRYYANQLYSQPVNKQTAIFEQILIKSEGLNKCEFFFEIISTILLLKRVDWIEIIFNKYYEEIFEIHEFNRLTHLWIFQIAQALLSIKEGSYKRAASELKKVNIDLAFDSYIDYIKLFSFIAIPSGLTHKFRYAQDLYLSASVSFQKYSLR
jgi:hypothetical protein